MKMRLQNRMIMVLWMLMMGIITTGISAQTPDLVCDSFQDSPTPERITYYMGEGAGFLAGRQYNNAIRSYSCVIEQLDANYIGAYNQRAVAYTMQQDYESAIEDYDTVLSLDNSSRAALNNRGIAYAALREYDRALEDFEAVVSTDDTYILGYLNRGVTQAIQGEFENAVTDLEQAIDLSDIESVVDELRDPNRASDAPAPEYDRDHAQMYAILGIIYSGYALDNYNDYLLLRSGSGDQRIQSAAGSLESRFNFDLRLDDGTWLLRADFTPAGEEALP